MIIRCQNGHYYESEKNIICPICALTNQSQKLLKEYGYETGRKIGEGATGIVFMVRKISDGTLWAAKEIKMSVPESRYAIRQEKSLRKKLSHPGIARIEEVIEFEDVAYIIMEYIDGQTIKSIIQHDSLFSESEVSFYGVQLCNALEYLHNNNIIYQDIKPSNIIITPSHKAVIVDFGSSQYYPIDANFQKYYSN